MDPAKPPEAPQETPQEAQREARRAIALQIVRDGYAVQTDVAVFADNASTVANAILRGNAHAHPNAQENNVGPMAADKPAAVVPQAQHVTVWVNA